MSLQPAPTTDQQPPPQTLGAPSDEATLLATLRAYHTDARAGRETGDNPRDAQWRTNVDLYWNRFDFSQKAPWQSKRVVPEVPQFVDRFAAAMAEALTSTDSFYTIDVPGDAEHDLGRALQRLMDYWLAEVGRTPQGHPLPFSAVFRDLVKQGALMNATCLVTPKKDARGRTYVAVEPTDTRLVWLDPTGRGMYRIRRLEMDRHELVALARAKRPDGRPLYDMDGIERAASELMLQEQEDLKRLQGTDRPASLPRRVVVLDEFLCTLLTPEGETQAVNTLVVVLNERHIIRGPEKNPFWHGMDWVVTAPFVSVPLSVYGKSYVENFAGLAMTFNDMTNLLLDAAYTSAIKAFALDVDALKNPEQAAEGVYPNVTFLVEGGADPNRVLSAIDLGHVSADAVQVWASLKNELRDAAMFNEISLGGFAPKGRTSASEIVASQQNASELLKAITRTIEERLLEPILNLVWMTNLQYMRERDPVLEQVAGPEMYRAIYARRREFIERPITFRARGLTALVTRQQTMRALLQLLSVIAQSEALVGAFFERVDAGKLLDQFFKLSNLDPDTLALSPRERLMRELTQPAQPPVQGPGAGPQPPTGTPPEVVAQEMTDVQGPQAAA